MTTEHRILITGIAGYIGSALATRLAAHGFVSGIDIRRNPALDCPQRIMDIRDPDLLALLAEQRITHVVHLAAVLEDSGDRARDYDIDVNGTRNVLDACLGAGVAHITVASSGAAYGYHADNPPWLSEDDALRGNASFPYADHKRQVETLLAEYRDAYPHLQQLILRPGTVLGATTRNLITNLFTGKRLLAIRGSDSPFVFIWDQDVIDIIALGVGEQRSGIYNLAGDGALSIYEIAAMLGKPVITLPATLIKSALWLGKRLGIGRYGPEQIDFLRYRPVLDNRQLKQEFGYTPAKTSAETLAYYIAHARARGDL